MGDDSGSLPRRPRALAALVSPLLYAFCSPAPCSGGHYFLMELPGLSLSPGLLFQDDLRATEGVPISSSMADSFLLVASFGRCKFKPSLSSVGLIIQATIGGNASCFKITALGDRVYKFAVACKQAGLAISRLRSFECDNYKVF